MATKGKVADVCDAFGMADTMLVGDIFVKKHKITSRKSSDPQKKLVLKSQDWLLMKGRPLLDRSLCSRGPLTFQVLSCRVSLDFIRIIFV